MANWPILLDVLIQSNFSADAVIETYSKSDKHKAKIAKITKLFRLKIKTIVFA